MNSEKTLIKLSKEGNKNAFEALVIKHQDKLQKIDVPENKIDVC